MTGERSTILTDSNYPDGVVVLGGMGVNISSKELAGAVAATGSIATLSETGGAYRLARTLRDGDPGGHIRESLEGFPNQAMVEFVLERYFMEDGAQTKTEGLRYRPVPAYRLENQNVRGLGVPEVEMLTVLDAYEQVKTARRIAGDRGIIGMNGLSKIPLPTPAALYGGMMAGLAFTARGAGDPSRVPKLIDELYGQNLVRYPIKVDYSRDDHGIHFDPTPYGGTDLSHPELWAIVSTTGGAKALAKAGAQAIIVESVLAGGHNAPLSGEEESFETYTDAVDRPLIFAGGVATKGLQWAVQRGAIGLQAGSIFAATKESGMSPSDRQKLIIAALNGTLTVRSDRSVSPTGFPFQLAEIPGTMAMDEVFAERGRVCDLSVLSSPYMRADGSIGYRCLGDNETVGEEKFARSEIMRRRIGTTGCLCNGLFAAADMGQMNPSRGREEKSYITLGQLGGHDINGVAREFGLPITAEKAVAYIRRGHDC